MKKIKISCSLLVLCILAACMLTEPVQAKAEDSSNPAVVLSAGQTGLVRTAAETNQTEPPVHVSRTGLPFYWILIAAGVGLLTAFIVMASLKAQLKTVHKAAAAASYLRSGSLIMAEQRDDFLYSKVDKTAKPKDNQNASGGKKR